MNVAVIYPVSGYRTHMMLGPRSWARMMLQYAGIHDVWDGYGPHFSSKDVKR